jgi:hypothetical protein
MSGIRPEDVRAAQVALGYHRAKLGGGQVLKAVTRTRRSAASRRLGKTCALKAATPNWRAHQRRAQREALRQLLEAAEAVVEASDG